MTAKGRAVSTALTDWVNARACCQLHGSPRVPGRATADRRYAVGQFSDPIARQLLDPAERIIVDQVRADRVPTGAADRIAYELVRRTGLTMVPRTIAIDHAIRDHGAGQLVMLGAGLDARAWRMPELARATVFEVHHPASQQDKLRRIGVLAPAARQVVPVALDLAMDLSPCPRSRTRVDAGLGW